MKEIISLSFLYTKNEIGMLLPNAHYIFKRELQFPKNFLMVIIEYIQWIDC